MKGDFCVVMCFKVNETVCRDIMASKKRDKRKTVVYQDAAVPCYITFYTKECTLPRS